MSQSATDQNGKNIFNIYLTPGSQVSGVTTRAPGSENESESDHFSFSRHYSSDSGVSELSSVGNGDSLTPPVTPKTEGTGKHHDEEDPEKLRSELQKLRSCVRIWIIVFVAIFSLLGVTIITVGIHLANRSANAAKYDARDAQNAPALRPSSPPLCLPCADLAQDASVTETGLQELIAEWDRDQCCARNQTQFLELLQRFIDLKIQHAEIDISKQQTTSGISVKSSAHLILNPAADLEKEGVTNAHTMKHWIYNNDIAHLASVTFIPSTGHLRIKQTGRYFIYTRASAIFTSPSDPPLNHSVHVKPTHAMSREILSGIRINRWSADIGYDLQTSFLSGTFFLRNNDEIYVQLNNMARLYFNDRNFRSTNFGLFMI